jgi:hypothetical protein
MVTLFVWHHAWTLFRRTWAEVIAYGKLVPVMKKLLSSAKNTGYTEGPRSITRSLIYRRNTIGLRTEPCETPLRTGKG